MKDYSHIQFKNHWQIPAKCHYRLGQCDALIQAISNIPLKPEYRRQLLQVSLIKGAQATTAIEGNTLTEEEIEKIQEGWKVPESREYQEIEVTNVIGAFNQLLKEVIAGEKKVITPELIKKFHQMIGENLGEHLDAIPGEFRKVHRQVGPYIAPKYQDVESLIKKLCEWIREEFNYSQGQKQIFFTAIIEAIVTHVYLEWIHPFGDGNGRTGRLLEFYILLRAGVPNIVSHVLSNFYNKTRSEYYRKLNQARIEKDLTPFIEYAVQGFYDGLKEDLDVIQKNQVHVFWHNYIYERFADLKYTKKEAFKRKRELILHFPLGKSLSFNNVFDMDTQVAKKYVTKTNPTKFRDLKELQEMKLLKKEGRNYMANIASILPMISIST